MKPTALITYSLFLLTSLSVSAAVPLSWTVETSRATPAQFEAYQGETIALEASLQSYGKPLEAPSNYSFYWQTNGMGSTYWEREVVVDSRSCRNEGENSTLQLQLPTTTNVLFATWSPEMDVGAKVYNCFIGQPGTIYHAAFQLRLRPSPGATPNVLPLPTPVIDFAKVTVLNPPWGSGGGTDTNDVIAIIHKTVDGSARPLPKYLHEANFADSYPEEAAAYYRSRGSGEVGGCSSVRSGGFLYRNFDFPFDDRAEFVVKMSAGPGRFASVGVAQVGTNITETMATSGKPLPPRFYKALPGATVDGINENGVVAEINVVDGDPQTSGWHTSGDIHPLAAVRWVLDHATNAQHAATFLAANIRFPQGWTQNYHYMIADETSTYIVENGAAHQVEDGAAMTNGILFPNIDLNGTGIERLMLLLPFSGITNAWYTRAYRRETNPPWVSDLSEVLAYTNEIFDAWATHPKEYFRGKTTNGQPWWQTIHTSIYDLTNRTLRVAVQETDDWYTFQVPSSGAKIDAYTKAETDEMLAGKLDTHGPVADGYIEIQFAGPDSETVRIYGDGVFATEGVGGDGYTAWVLPHDGRRDDTFAGISDVAAKASKPSSATSGNLALLTEDGDLADGGIAATNVATKSELSNALCWTNNAVKTRDGSHTVGAADVGALPFRSPIGVEIYWGTCSVLYFGNNAYIDAASGEIESSEAITHNSNPVVYGITVNDGEPMHGDVNLTIPVVDPTDPTFSNAVMSVATGISTNDWAVIASVADWASVLPGGVPGGAGTLGAVLAALAATVLALKKKTSLLKSDGTAEDDFATNLLGKQVAKTALMIQLETVEAGISTITAEDGHAYAVTMTGTVTITMPTTTEGKAAIFQARFSAAAQQSVEFSTTALVKFDGADCGIVKAGKDALLSAMWNGEAWDLVWKNEA